MADLTIIAWRWGTKYGPEYVEKLERGISRHLRQGYRFLEVAPDPADPLLQEPGCFVRLRMFDPAFQRLHGIEGRLVNIDLDVVVTGPLDPLFDRPESFLILQGANSVNPCPYNGSLWMLQTGRHAGVWHSFSVDAAYQVPYFKFPDDQTWLAHRIPNAAGWPCGFESGIWSFRKRGWPHDDALPYGARLVAFPGAADPKHVESLEWMQKHWR